MSPGRRLVGNTVLLELPKEGDQWEYIFVGETIFRWSALGGVRIKK